MQVTEKPLEGYYDLFTPIGKGTFGTVTVGRAIGAGDGTEGARPAYVAIKTVRCTDSPDRQREVQFFRKVPGHPHLVSILEMLWDTRRSEVHFVLELMDGTLLEWLRARREHSLSPASVLAAALQLAKGIGHIHAHGFIHRDLKPENVLVGKIPKGTSARFCLKIADFGLARRIEVSHTESRPWTSYVATRWYRAPEQVTAAGGSHTPALDMWALGTLIVEICNLQPLFPGRDMLEMLEMQLRALGRPSATAFGGRWENDCPPILATYQSENEDYRGFSHFRQLVKRREYEIFASAFEPLLRWDPMRRPPATTLIKQLREIHHSGQAWARKTVRRVSPIPGFVAAHTLR